MAEKPPLLGGTGNGKTTDDGLGSGGVTFGGADSTIAHETATAAEVQREAQKASASRELLPSEQTSDSEKNSSACILVEPQGHFHEQQTSKETPGSHTGKLRNTSADHPLPPACPSETDPDSHKERLTKIADLHKRHVINPPGNKSITSDDSTLPQQCSDINLSTKTFSAAVKDNTFKDDKRKTDSADLKQGANKEDLHDSAAGQTTRAEMTPNKPLDQVEVRTACVCLVRYLPHLNITVSL